MAHSPSSNALDDPMNAGKSRFLSLRTKFVLFFSLILIVSCSTLSWYLIENRRAAMAENLRQLGTILLTNVVGNEHFRYAGLVAQDRATLREFVDGLMAVQDVVYVVVRGPDGAVITKETKGGRRSPASLLRSPEYPLYPDESIAHTLLSTPHSAPKMTPLSIVNVVSPRFAWEERVYDFAMPVLRTTPSGGSIAPFSLQLEERSQPRPSPDGPQVSGLVQIGLSDANLNHELLSMVTNVILLTVVIIAAGILGAHILSSKITTPLRGLAAVAHQVAE